MQRQHAILRNFPIIGHFRYWLEAVGPELRQYIVTDNNEERPFSRDQRRWIYASAKRENNYFGFGSDNEMELQPNYLIIKHDTFPLRSPSSRRSRVRSAVPRFRARRCWAAPGGGARAFRPASVVNVSGMSFGVAERAGRRGAQPRLPDRRLPPEHRRRRRLVAPPAGRRSRVADRHRLLRLPRTRRPLQHGEAEGHDRARAADPRDRDQAQPGRQARASAACCRGRRSARRSPTIRGIPIDRDCISPAGAQRVPERRRAARFRRVDRRARPACRSASSPPSATRRSGRTWRR